jgi:hypothetical protein
MAVHLLKELIFWAAEKGFRESEVRIRRKQRKKYQFRLDQLWCCIRILLKPEARATGHGHASAGAEPSPIFLQIATQILF